jgi:hypothetical protein
MVASMDTSDFLEVVANGSNPIPHFEGMAKLPEREGSVAVVP